MQKRQIFKLGHGIACPRIYHIQARQDSMHCVDAEKCNEPLRVKTQGVARNATTLSFSPLLLGAT